MVKNRAGLIGCIPTLWPRLAFSVGAFRSHLRRLPCTKNSAKSASFMFGREDPTLYRRAAEGLDHRHLGVGPVRLAVPHRS